MSLIESYYEFPLPLSFSLSLYVAFSFSVLLFVAWAASLITVMSALSSFFLVVT